ncbi:unnamed protein product [Medioppia subpectinata]|uniref:Uncharacterized protein n=1 Tax=Medioppia subpectinata TaxID=1979941 RepID=A0A7R9Q2V1_9ACAR|nr:unnamed protein product [Medioppia subpectinata]CAG2109818.1 unnamed protein product [Medioppia subpectinata]
MINYQGNTSLGAPTTRSANDIYKDELIKRGEALETRVKNSIAKLISEDRGHLAAELEEEETRITALINELKTTSPGPEALKLLEGEIARVEDRVTREEKLIEKETDTQDKLLANAKTLKTFVGLALVELSKVTGKDKPAAEKLAEELYREERRLDMLCQELIDAQTPRKIAEYEVEVRVHEVRVSELLRRAHFFQPTPAPPTPTTA